MPYYKTPLAEPITILCAGRIGGAWGVFGQELTGRGGLWVDQADLSRAKHPDGRSWFIMFRLLLAAATHSRLVF